MAVGLGFHIYLSMLTWWLLPDCIIYWERERKHERMWECLQPKLIMATATPKNMRKLNSYLTFDNQKNDKYFCLNCKQLIYCFNVKKKHSEICSFKSAQSFQGHCMYIICTVYKSTHRSDTVDWNVWGLDEPTIHKDIFRSVGKIPTWTALNVGLLETDKVQDKQWHWDRMMSCVLTCV